MANSPVDSSLLFGVLDNTGCIKELKNDKYPGSFRMELEGVDDIDWFTDQPYIAEGKWKQK